MPALDPLTAGLDLANTVVKTIWPDKSDQERAQLAAAVQLVQGQLDINKVEAASESVFVAGWRPFIGWTCGVAFAYKFVLAPVAALVLTAVGHPITLPVLEFGEMMPILFGMLGLGAFRSYEKVKGVAK
jgi:uncharacterized protein (DUF2062 family)